MTFSLPHCGQMIGTKFGSDWNMKSHTVHAKYTIDWSMSSMVINSALRYIYLTILRFKVLPGAT